LVDAIFARTRTSFGIGQTVYFSFINKNVSIEQILLRYYFFDESYVWEIWVAR